MAELQSGTITFLFTDIEGSTRLWEQHPEAMRDALARHDTLAAAVIEQHAGTLVKSRGEGDSLFAVFARPTAALAAACVLQQTLLSEPWPPEVPLRVRMALHVAAAEPREGDYYGPGVNRCARFRAVAHGGQVLLSQATADMVRETLPAGASLRDLGAHRLKDLQQPEHLFQLLHPALPADFPPLRSLEAFAHNLPRQLTSFIGREKEMAEVKQLLATTSLLTLTGSGGCGKTRLALQVAADLLEEYADGAWLVELAALADPALVPQTVASALGVREEPNRPLLATLADYLRPKSLLLVLDNCEHLLAACAQLSDTLLRACPKLQVLASSREGLGISGEQTYRVPSLSLPDPRQLPPPERLRQFEAVQLFADRAGLARPSFAVTAANAAPVAQVCHRLDGIPLAIELAAARVRVLSVEQLAARLDDRFRLLTGGSRTALPRQQTLRALIDWSYDLLSEAERALLRRLSVFSGGWTLEGAEAVCAGERIEAPDVLDLLSGLVDKSLVVVDGQDEKVRYRLLETVRQYAGDRLLDAGEAEAVRSRHLEYFVGLAEEAEPQLRGPQQAIGLERLESEHDNLCGALRWSADGGNVQIGVRLGGALGPFWRGYPTEGRERLRALLALPEASTRTAARAKALSVVGHLAYPLDDYGSARTALEESAAIWREIGDRQGLAYSLLGLGAVMGRQGDYRAARCLQEENVALFRAVGDEWGLAFSLFCLGFSASLEGDYEAARSLHQESLALFRKIGDEVEIARVRRHLGFLSSEQGDLALARSLLEEALAIDQQRGHKWGIAISLSALGDVARFEGDYGRAALLYQESLALLREMGSTTGIAGQLLRLGHVAQHEGEIGRAQALFAESLALRRETGNKRVIAECLAGFAGVAAAREQTERAARLLGAAAAMLEAIGVVLERADRVDYDRSLATVRAAMSEAAFSAAWDEGRAMPLEHALEYAFQEVADG